MSIESCRGESATLSKKKDLFRLESKNGFRLLPWKKLICKMNATLRTHPLIHSQPLLQTRCVGKRLRRFAGARAFILVQPCVALTLTGTIGSDLTPIFRQQRGLGSRQRHHSASLLQTMCVDRKPC